MTNVHFNNRFVLNLVKQDAGVHTLFVTNLANFGKIKQLLFDAAPKNMSQIWLSCYKLKFKELEPWWFWSKKRKVQICFIFCEVGAHPQPLLSR